MPPIADLGRLRELFAERGVTQLFVKRLSPNDNSKNQIYLGSSFEVLNQLPFSDPVVQAPRSGHEIVHADVRLEWLTDSLGESPAPHTKLILYPQYPEARLSGFLRGAEGAPSELLNSHARIDGRMLFLGVRSNRTVLSFICGPDDPLALELAASGVFDSGKPLVEIELGQEPGRAVLLRCLGEVASEGWIPSARLDTEGTMHPCLARNCGGLTLEARLGIPSNSSSEPDFHGWEVKQFGAANFRSYSARSPLTLFTPEPTVGVYASHGVEPFIRAYGYADVQGRPDRLNFGGKFIVDRPASRTGLTLLLAGYDRDTGKISSVGGGLELRAPDGTLAAGWPFPALIEHWNRKHARAAYVPSMKQDEPRAYRYGARVFLGTGTDFGLLLAAFAAGAVSYDPGIKLEQASGPRPQVHRRSQFRIDFRRLGLLYRSFEAVETVSGSGGVHPEESPSP